MSILVIGDVMLDRYWFGDVSRLSQEAPVPVVRMEREDRRPGAAANVAMNCRAMGADTALVSIVGDDAYGRGLLRTLEDHNIEADGCMLDSLYATVQKLRVIGKQQQIVRIDFEDRPPKDAIDSMTEVACNAMAAHDVIVISDYGKGVLANVQTLIAKAKSLGKTVLVDPKGYSFDKYRGADVIKPNLDELRELVGGWGSEDELSEKAHMLLAKGGFRAILLTRASEGMTLFTADDTFNVPTEAREVYDVSGAGDTAISAFAVALTRGEGFQGATKFANKAAGLVVAKFGTAVATEQEVFE
jgi:rfaE bifunctional protein kinase chain/domain